MILDISGPTERLIVGAALAYRGDFMFAFPEGQPQKSPEEVLFSRRSSVSRLHRRWLAVGPYGGAPWRSSEDRVPRGSDGLCVGVPAVWLGTRGARPSDCFISVADSLATKGPCGRPLLIEAGDFAWFR